MSSQSTVYAPLVAALVVLGALLSSLVVPGVFTVDDNNYFVNVVMLRDGSVTLRNTAGLPPTNELLAFDPSPWTRAVLDTPVASTAPPLYAPLAWPFSMFGWRGLVALNTLAFLSTAFMVFMLTRRYVSSDASAWLAASAFALGGYSLEYAMGVWPHCVSAALVTAGLMAAMRSIENKLWHKAALAGLLLGVSAGVRYQNAALLFATGAAVFIWSPIRWKSSGAFGLTAALPLAASATINYARLGSWNPISKGPGYLPVPVSAEAWSVTDPFTMFWARVVDYSHRPELTERWADFATYDPDTGAHLVLGLVVKKALLQSAPWAVLGALMLFTAWLSSRQRGLDPNGGTFLRVVSVPIACIVAVFALASVGRDDGLNFNQRYLMEVVPLAAVALGIAVDGLRWKMRHVLMGAFGGLLVSAALLMSGPLVDGPDAFSSVPRQLIILKVPLVISTALGLGWIAARLGRRASVMAIVLGASLAWGLCVHVLEDVTPSLRIRQRNLTMTRRLAEVLPGRSAFIAYRSYRDAAVPLLAERDLLVVDVGADEGAAAPELIEAMLKSGRRVFILDAGFPPEVRDRVLGGLTTSQVPFDADLRLLEANR